MVFTTYTESETERIGERLGRILPPGGIVALKGGLGAGKTVFTRGLARGVGYGGRVTSPTYTIVNEYIGGRVPVFHFDLYRIEDGDQLFDIGWEDYLEREGICVVEWSENAGDMLPGGTISVAIEAESNIRKITIEGISFEDTGN